MIYISVSTSCEYQGQHLVSFVRRLTNHIAGAGLALQLSLPHHTQMSIYVAGAHQTFLNTQFTGEA